MHWRTVRNGVLVIGAFAVLAALAGPDLALENMSASMATGTYVWVPFAAPEPGAIVAFPVPEAGRTIAAAAGIRGLLLKRVAATDADGGLIVRGDCGGDRNFDSRVYGPIEPGSLTGVYRPIPGLTRECQGDFSGYAGSWIGTPDKAALPRPGR